MNEQAVIPVEESLLLKPEDYPDLEQFVIEDGKPVESVFIEKQYRLLTEPLHSSWSGPAEGQPWVAMSNVGLFYAVKRPPLVPDMMLAVDVEQGTDLSDKANLSYFVWLRGKVPDVVIEIVSDRRGGEATYKMREYARIRIPYYVILDPRKILSGDVLRGFVLQGTEYRPASLDWLPEVGLGLRLWEGEYEGVQIVWLRWCDQEGNLIPTGSEKAERERLTAEQEHQRAEQERQRAEQERQRAEQERQRADQHIQEAERLRAKLRELGVDPSV